eukprot:SAG11_NODE_15446_length_578_cov_0.736952_1_plen_100_part_01
MERHVRHPYRPAYTGGACGQEMEPLLEVTDEPRQVVTVERRARRVRVTVSRVALPPEARARLDAKYGAQTVKSRLAYFRLKYDTRLNKTNKTAYAGGWRY